MCCECGLGLTDRAGLVLLVDDHEHQASCSGCWRGERCSRHRRARAHTRAHRRGRESHAARRDFFSIGLLTRLGQGGFIGSHLAKRLLNEGNHVIVADWARNEYFKESEFCSEFLLLDLRDLNNCLKATAGVEWVFMLAADMGGMGFIQSNHSVILYNNTMISYNMLEAARRCGVKRFFYSSSACIYPVHAQKETANPGLKESDAWPAQPEDAYGLEKLASEEMCKVRAWRRATREPHSMPLSSTTWLTLVSSPASAASTTSTGPRARGAEVARSRPPHFAARCWPTTRTLRCGATASRPAATAMWTNAWRACCACSTATCPSPSTLVRTRWFP